MALTDHINIPYGGERFCATLAARVLADVGIPYPVHANRPSDAVEWVKVERPKPYDVVVFPKHVGVYIGQGQFLHVEEGSRSCVDYLESPFWAPRIRGFYRYVGEKHGTADLPNRL